MQNSELKIIKGVKGNRNAELAFHSPFSTLLCSIYGVQDVAVLVNHIDCESLFAGREHREARRGATILRALHLLHLSTLSARGVYDIVDIAILGAEVLE